MEDDVGVGRQGVMHRLTRWKVEERLPCWGRSRQGGKGEIASDRMGLGVDRGGLSLDQAGSFPSVGKSENRGGAEGSGDHSGA